MKNKVMVIILFIIVITSIIIFNFNRSEEIVEAQMSDITNEEENDSNKIDENVSNNSEEKKSKIKVDIKGAVSKPGVYEIENDKRVIDAVKLAGGLTKNANTNYINLSTKLKDEMVIWIYTNEEIEKLNLKETSIEYMIKECNCPQVDNTTCLSNTETSNKQDALKSSDSININTASLEELTMLNGIGNSKAKSIIEYREKNGNFKSKEELMNVSGIGESAYNKIKDYIEV